MSRDPATRPEWQRGTRTRLIASIAVAAILLATVIVVTEIAHDEELIEGIEITLLERRTQEQPRQPEEPIEPLLVEETVRELPLRARTAEPAAPDAPPQEPKPVSRDWYAEMDKVIADVVAGEQQTYSLNPVFDAQRRDAAEQFRPSRAPVEKPIWENVATDQLGRKILVHGDCHRVIDDPNVGSNEIFRTFGQFIVFCGNYKRPPQELPWVDEIRDRRVYLQPDPEVRGAPRSHVVADLR